MTAAATAESTARCPKHMVYGPCGGVRADSGCEMAAQPCPFADATSAVPYLAEHTPGTVDLPEIRSAPSGLLSAIDRGPVVLTDLTVLPFDPASVTAILAELEGSCDAVLVGEHQNRPDFPPPLMARLIAEAGARAWVTLSCRDRNRLVLEQEIAALLHVGVDGVLCVTGDGRAQGIRPGVTQVFDLDGTRLAAMAARAGLVVAVPESPAAPPTRLRAERLREKQRAGAAVCVLNHVRSEELLRTFSTQCAALGVTTPLIASVAVYTDERSADVLQRFPGFHLDSARVAAVLNQADPESAGIDEAVREARELLAVPGVAGVNLSGLASGRGEVAAARIKREVGFRIRSGAS